MLVQSVFQSEDIFSDIWHIFIFICSPIRAGKQFQIWGIVCGLRWSQGRWVSKDRSFQHRRALDEAVDSVLLASSDPRLFLLWTWKSAFPESTGQRRACSHHHYSCKNPCSHRWLHMGFTSMHEMVDMCFVGMRTASSQFTKLCNWSQGDVGKFSINQSLNQSGSSLRKGQSNSARSSWGWYRNYGAK